MKAGKNRKRFAQNNLGKDDGESIWCLVEMRCGVREGGFEPRGEVALRMRLRVAREEDMRRFKAMMAM